MYAPPTGLRALLLIALFLPAAAGLAQEGESIRELKVREVLSACDEARAAQIWEASEQLVQMGPPARRVLRKVYAEAPTEGKLAALRALIELDSTAYAAEKLIQLAEDESVGLQHRLLAIELIGQTEEEDAEEGLLDLLHTYNPQLQLASARALWNLDSPRKHEAKKVLRELLTSSNPDLQAQGALTLAEIGDAKTPGVRDTLLRLSREPGPRGRLAAALLDKLKLEKVIEFTASRSDEANATSRKKSPWSHLDEIRRILKEIYDFADEVEDDKLRTSAARGLLYFPQDPHTLFLSPDQYQEFLHGSEGVDPSYGGIGAFIDTNVKDRFRILRPIFGGPAWKADIRGGDDIVAVNGRPTAGRTTTDIIKDVKGPPGTPVILSIMRQGWRKPREITVIRAKIVLPTVTSRMLPGKVGYITIAQFAYETGKELYTHLRALEDQGMQGLVIDLRDNPGGLLASVKQCLTIFLKQRELVCTVKGRAYSSEKHYTGRPDKPREYPISILLNGRSASGAELMSGVMQHYSKTSDLADAKEPYLDAVVLGEASFGKGTVQHTMPLRAWPGETFTDRALRNGRFDFNEEYQDRNGNRRYDPGETYTDRPMLNRRWDDAEPWEDTNGNGTRDPDETFTDENNDGRWNPAEEFDDANGNGRYDYGAAIKLSVARYYLPGGRNFTRTRIFKDGGYIYEGGVLPDVEVKNPELEVSDLVVLRELQQKGLFTDYVKSRWSEHRDTFHKLAWFDARDIELYPDFEAFYETLKTRLSRQHVRSAIRVEVRREVANELGREILGDLSDDLVLRRGVRDVLRRAGVESESIPEYRTLKNGLEAK